MTSIFLIHGIEGNPEENWFPWIKKELELLNFTVFAPEFPDSDNPELPKWIEFFEQYSKHVKNDSIFIGHSMGVPFILNLLELYPAKACFFVAGFTGKMNNKFAERMKKFSEREFDWKKIKRNCRKFFVFYSDNDPFVKAVKGRELAEKLEAELIEVKNAGHFNSKAGYTEFELLLEKIKKELK